jgi:hypothetical protein
MKEHVRKIHEEQFDMEFMEKESDKNFRLWGSMNIKKYGAIKRE